MLLPGNRIIDFCKFYNSYKFQILGTKLNFSLVKGLRKVVIFGFTPEHPQYTEKKEKIKNGAVDDGPICTHAIVQMTDGIWSSKMGDGEEILVSDPLVLGGPVYGEPIFMFVKQIL